MSATHHTPRSSPLLALPAELRNVIYGYVLAASKRIICAQFEIEEDHAHKYYEKGVQVRTSGIGASPHNSKATVESNQLQHVCRLLRRETSSFVPSSHIVFLRRSDKHSIKTASVTCSRWLDTLARSHIDALRTITIHEGIPWGVADHDFAACSGIFDLNAVEHLARFCSSSPHIQVKIYLARFDKQLKGFCRRSLIGYIVSMAVRKEDCCAAYGCTSGEARAVEDAVERMSSVWGGYAKDKPPLPENLRLFPVGQFQCDDWPTNKSRPELRSRIKRWYEEGI
ncbi:hypothetical protein ST47_g6441 [Ascochyta rabiei]|uniref:Uncharacterized protein n=2 Tax=Didymella rabiei TaxID=5454 RepID=A0A163CFA1_DIDRA|nr:hypothetical protein ST47_g6441 [Ascochyta rabiei]